MELCESFTSIYDKAKSVGNAQRFINKWVIDEHETDASMTHLEVIGNGVFLGFDHDLVKGVKDSTIRLSSYLQDKDCDGIAFLTDANQQEHLVFAELKSNFDAQKIAKAFHQIIMSFIKMHTWLSLCKYYDLKNLKVHFIAACKCFKDNDQETGILHRISELQQIGEDSFETKFLKPLLKGHKIQVRLSSFRDIQNLPIHDNIYNKEITMYLQLTKDYNDSQTTITIS